MGSGSEHCQYVHLCAKPHPVTGSYIDGASPCARGVELTEAEKTRFTEDRAEHRRLQRIDEKKAALTCFACRGTGHSARECPNAGAEGSGNICYRYVSLHCYTATTSQCRAIKITPRNTSVS